MDIIPYNLETGKLNSNYDLIKNCRVTKPPYEADGFYSSEFFLDKRYSIENMLPLINQDGREFLDYIDANGYRYYYYKLVDKTYIGVFDSNDDFQNITPDGFIIDSDSPLRLTKGFGAYGASVSGVTVGTNVDKTIFRGEYDNTVSYAVNDIIIYGSQYYLCISESTAQLPTNATYWSSVEAGLPATYTGYTFTFSSNLDNNPSVLTIDGKDILIWEQIGNEELARDQVLERLKEVFPTYTITRVGLKFILNNGGTAVVVALKTVHDTVKKIEFSGTWDADSKVSVTVDGTTHTTTGDVTADLEVWIYDLLSGTYRIKTLDSGIGVVIANNVGTYTNINHIGADIVATKTEYNRYTYVVRAWDLDNPSGYNVGGTPPETRDVNTEYVKTVIDGVTYQHNYPNGIQWTAYEYSHTIPFRGNVTHSSQDSNFTASYGAFYDFVNAGGTDYIITSNAAIYDGGSQAHNEYTFDFRRNDYAAVTKSSERKLVIDSNLNTLVQANQGDSNSFLGTNHLVTIDIISYNGTSDTVGEEQVGFVASIPSYDNGYLSFEYSGTITADTGYLLFTTGALKGITVKFEFNESGKLFLLGTNIRGTIPKTDDQFEVFKFVGDTIYVGGRDNLYQVTLDGTLPSPNIQNSLTLTDNNFIDVTNFNGSIFALTKDKVYYSNYSTYSNGDFYELNFYNVIGGYRLFNIGKSIIIFAGENKIISPIQISNKTLFGMYDFNYNGNLFSKYSCLFADQTIMILQDDKQLMEVDIIETAKNTFDLKVKQVTSNVRGIFSNIFGGEIFFDNSDKELIMLNVEVDALQTSGYKTTAYVYDKEYEHWKLNEYKFKINKIGGKYTDVYGTDRPGIIGINHLSELGNTYLDLGIHSYQQEVNMRLGDGERLMFPYIIRTLFGMPNEPLDVTLETSFEIGGKKQIQVKNLTGFEHDLRITQPEETLDDLIGFEDDEFSYGTLYDGSVVGIQSNILKTGRFVFFKYYSEKRFIIGKSFVITDKTKTFINELTLTN